MLDRVLTHASYEPLIPLVDGDGLRTETSKWCRLVEFAVSHGSSALIDAGAHLAGVDINDVAVKVGLWVGRAA